MNNKVAIVTGSSSGIGCETAIHFVGKGINVVVTGRREKLVNEVVDTCNNINANGAKAIGVICDITKNDDANKLVNTAVETFGRIDYLINNAGVGVINSVSDDDLMEKYDRLMDTNIKAVVYLCHLVAPYLETTKGCIVNVSSTAAFRPNQLCSLYCMSKAALNMFTKCLALELGPKGIRVNCVNPSYIKTDIFRTLNISEDKIALIEKEKEATYPLRRIGQPIDVAKAIAFLISDDASFTTGECLLVDGGALFSST